MVISFTKVIILRGADPRAEYTTGLATSKRSRFFAGPTTRSYVRMKEGMVELYIVLIESIFAVNELLPQYRVYVL
jgi:hypothetical protein